MSWQIFKDNIVRMSDNPDAIPDIDIVAKTYAREYDAAIKRGKDTIEGVSLQKGNVDIMEALFKAALQKGLTSTEPYDLVGEMGKGVLAYWGGAVMNNFPNPKTLPPGAVSNISVTSNVVMDPGKWQASPPLPPASQRFIDPDELLDPDADRNNLDNGEAEEFYAVEPITSEELAQSKAQLELYSLSTPNLQIEEITIIENPEEIIYVESPPDITIEDDNIRVPNQIETNPEIKVDLKNAKVPANIGTGGMPPGFEKYVVDRSKVPIRKGASKRDGGNGSIPSSALVTIKSVEYGTMQLHVEAAAFFAKFIEQAKKDKVSFTVSSSYRSYENQVACWNDLEAGKAATPGHSNHGWGIAVDIRELYRAVGGSIQAEPNKKVRNSSDLYKYFATTAPFFGWFNPSVLCDGTKTDEVWHWEYHGFESFTTEQRKAAGEGIVIPTETTTTKTDTKTQKTNSTTPAGYVTYNMDLNGPVAFIFGGIPSDKSGAKYMDSQIPLNIKKTKKIVVSNWENLQNNKFLKDFPNVKISSISGWSKAGEFIIPNIESYLKSGYFVGLMDPSTTSAYKQAENVNLKMIYRPENWSTIKGIAFDKNLESFGKSMGASAQLTTSGHYLIPGEFFKKFGNKL
jgi:LAS superfamily LD-carboxypeptidase LdcB